MKIHLSNREKQVLLFLASYAKEHRFPPTAMEISRNFGWKSATSAIRVMHSLRKLGKISWQDDKKRSIQVL